jgi:hypothetical protein
LSDFGDPVKFVVYTPKPVKPTTTTARRSNRDVLFLFIIDLPLYENSGISYKRHMHIIHEKLELLTDHSFVLLPVSVEITV